MRHNQPQKSQHRDHRKPDVIAYAIREYGEGNSFWSSVGAGWMHEDKKGMSLQLTALPVDGKLVLRKPKPAEQDNAGEQKHRAPETATQAQLGVTDDDLPF